MGCPDAVRAALLQLPGMQTVRYHPEADYFTLRFEAVLVTLENIFTRVVNAGRQMGQEYSPEIISA